jgi:hypothetical protein
MSRQSNFIALGKISLWKDICGIRMGSELSTQYSALRSWLKM